MFDRVEKESGTELPHSKGAFGVRQLVAAFTFNQPQRGWRSLLALFVSGRVEKESGTELPHSKGAFGVRQLVAAFTFNQPQRGWRSLLALFVSGRMEKESGTELPHSKGPAAALAGAAVLPAFWPLTYIVISVKFRTTATCVQSPFSARLPDLHR